MINVNTNEKLRFTWNYRSVNVNEKKFVTSKYSFICIIVRRSILQNFIRTKELGRSTSDTTDKYVKQ